MNTLEALLSDVRKSGAHFTNCEFAGVAPDGSSIGGRSARVRGTQTFKSGVVTWVYLRGEGVGIMADVEPPVEVAEAITALEAAGCEFNDTP